MTLSGFSNSFTSGPVPTFDDLPGGRNHVKTHDIDTRHLRSGDRVLVTPSPLQHNRFFAARTADAPHAEWRTVAYTSRVEARPEMRNWLDVSFEEGGWSTSPASSTYVTDISARKAAR